MKHRGDRGEVETKATDHHRYWCLNVLAAYAKKCGIPYEELEADAHAHRRLEVAIADLARKFAPRSARMTTRALKRDLAALERDYVEDDDRSPKARAAEAQRAARGLNAERKRKARETGACGKVDGSMEQCVTTGGGVVPRSGSTETSFTDCGIDAAVEPKERLGRGSM